MHKYKHVLTEGYTCVQNYSLCQSSRVFEVSLGRTFISIASYVTHSHALLADLQP